MNIKDYYILKTQLINTLIFLLFRFAFMGKFQNTIHINVLIVKDIIYLKINSKDVYNNFYKQLLLVFMNISLANKINVKVLIV